MAKDIDVAASLSWGSSNRLTLSSSHGTITFSKVVDVAGPGAMTLITKYDRLGGYLYFTRKGRVDFRNTTSSLIINGNSYGLITSIHDLKVAGGNVPYLAFAKNIKAAKAYSDVPVETFQDTLEGLGHSISHLTISSTQTEQPLGLVGTQNGTIRDLHLIDVNILGPDEDAQGVGALVGTNNGSIFGVSATGHVSSSGRNAVVGGLVGYNGGAVWRSSAAVSVTAGDTGSAGGGLIGHNVGFGGANVLQSYATGSLTGGDGAALGGLVG